MASGTQWEREEVSPKEASVEMRLELGVDGWRDLEPVQEGEFNPTNSGESLKLWGLPGGASGKEPACQCRRHKRCRFDPWVGKIPWRRVCQPTAVFLPGQSHGQRSLAGLQNHRVTRSQT